MGKGAAGTNAFVLSGGGSLGGVQVGMLRALSERGWHADLFVGSSAGALNAGFLTARGFTPRGADRAHPERYLSLHGHQLLREGDPTGVSAA